MVTGHVVSEYYFAALVCESIDRCGWCASLSEIYRICIVSCRKAQGEDKVLLLAEVEDVIHKV